MIAKINLEISISYETSAKRWPDFDRTVIAINVISQWQCNYREQAYLPLTLEHNQSDTNILSPGNSWSISPSTDLNIYKKRYWSHFYFTII